MRLNVLLALATVLLATGCANRDIRLEANDRAFVSTIRLQVEEGKVTYSGKLPMRYENDSGNGLLANQYLLPLGVAYEIYRYPKVLDRKSETMRAVFKECELSVPELVGTRFLEAVDQRPPFASFVKGEESDARLVLTVSYGVSGFSLLRDGYVPWLQVRGELLGADDRVLWRKTSSIDSDEPPMRELPFPDPFAKPKLIRKLFSKAAQKSCQELLEDLFGER